ncbi:MAG: DegQ family serine endoprotease [Candidatus Abyssubacteria bacterium]
MRTAALTVSLAVVAVFALAYIAPAPASARQAPASFADLADAVKGPVVNLSTTQIVKTPFVGPGSRFREFFGEEFFEQFFGQIPQEMQTRALGSGFVIDKEGHILTNNHVIENATEIRVILSDEKEYSAVVVGRDPKTELALIKVEPDEHFPEPATLGDSDKIRVGDWVMAIGNPFGLGHTVTVGIISAKGRIIGAGPYDDFLQTDAAINPGNSGGPLFNMDGKVVGINTAIVARGQGIGFAIPINMATQLLPQLKKGKIVRGWLGIIIQNVTPELARSFGLKEAKGVLISDIMEDAPAQKAGLMRGDIIIRLNEKDVEDANWLSRHVAELSPGDAATLDIVRNGQEKTVKVTIGTMPSDGEEAEEPVPQEEENWGFSTQPLTPGLAQALGLEPGEQGIVVSNVRPGSPADDAGLQAGDLIKEVNRQEVRNMQDYRNALEKRKKDAPLLLLVKRDEFSFYVSIRSAQ